MTSPVPRARTAAAAHATELLRRWPALLLMVAVPGLFFAVSYLTSDDALRVPASAVVAGAPSAEILDRDVEALYLAVLGVSVSASFAAHAAIRGSAAFTRRLRLAGYGAAHLLGGRVAVLLAAAAVAAMVFAAVLTPLVPGAHAARVTGALLAVALVATGLGALLGVYLAEFEAAMVIVAVSGLEVAVGRSSSQAGAWLLYTPAVDALKAAAFGGTGWGGGVARAIVPALLLLGAAYCVWARRTRVGDPPRTRLAEGTTA